MSQVLHSSACTTEATRRVLQRSKESVRALVRRYDINPTTVQKWRRREMVAVILPLFCRMLRRLRFGR